MEQGSSRKQVRILGQYLARSTRVLEDARKYQDTLHALVEWVKGDTKRVR